MTKKNVNLSGSYTYHCQSCDLFFLPEELPEKYIKSKKKCVRCLVEEKRERNEINLPLCYGKKYDGALEACIRYCTLQYACMIENIDWTSDNIILEKSTYVNKSTQGANKKRRGKVLVSILRLLRTISRPMHVRDVAPLVAKMVGEERRFIKNKGFWINKIRQTLGSHHEIVALGEGFYIWVGAWDLKDGGSVSPWRQKPEEPLISIEDIFKDI